MKIACFFPLVIVAFAALVLESSTAFDPVTLTLGGTAFVLTGTQVALTVAGLAGLAIAKEKLIIADLSRRRGRREVEGAEVNQVDVIDALEPFVDAVAFSDVSGCGSKLICHVMATKAEERSEEQSRLAKLFEDFADVYSPSYAMYRDAAVLGSSGDADLCDKQFFLCPTTKEGLEAMLEAHN